MSQVKVTNKKSGITYVYESESYWDKEKKQPRNKRKLIGKIILKLEKLYLRETMFLIYQMVPVIFLHRLQS